MDLNQFFNNWDTADSYAALAITLIGFLFGLLIGYLLRGPRLRRLRNELEEARQQLADARKEIGLMKDQLDKKEADLQKVNYDLVEIAGQIDGLEKSKTKLLKEVFHANQEVEKQQAANRSYLTTINDLNAQISQFEAEWEKKALVATPDEASTEQTNYSGEEIPSENPALYNETQLRLERFESKLAHLESENQLLKGQIQELRPTAFQTPREAPLNTSDLIFEIDDVQEEPELVMTSDKEVLHEKIVVSELEKDDLTKIEGIGPGLQKKLNEIGVYTYAEVAQWDATRTAKIGQEIWIPGRIEKDDWVGQANRLHQMKLKSPKTYENTAGKVEDLKVIEGIGPKIEQLLKDAGISSWHELADTELEQLQSILSAAGDRYRIHDPGTWPQQARLAANAQWEELQSLQNELKGGRKKD